MKIMIHREAPKLRMLEFTRFTLGQENWLAEAAIIASVK